MSINFDETKIGPSAANQATLPEHLRNSSVDMGDFMKRNFPAPKTRTKRRATQISSNNDSDIGTALKRLLSSMSLYNNKQDESAVVTNVIDRSNALEENIRKYLQMQEKYYKFLVNTTSTDKTYIETIQNQIDTIEAMLQKLYARLEIEKLEREMAIYRSRNV